MCTTVHLIYRTPSSMLGNKAPYEMIFSHVPEYDLLRVFGGLCFAHKNLSGVSLPLGVVNVFF